MVGECFDLCSPLSSLGRSRRDRGAELLDGLLARVAGTYAAGKYDLDVGNADKA
jgi:hypothetical protein